MKLRSLNIGKGIDKYGYPDNLEYEDDNFHGHQKGIAIGIQDDATKEWVNNLLSENLGDKSVRDMMLNDLIQDPSILIVENNIAQMVDNIIRARTIYYLPYYVVDHSCLMPTLNFKNIDCATPYKVTIELLFVTDSGVNRYITIETVTKYLCLLDIVDSLFDEMSQNTIPEITQEINGKHGTGYYLDFYNEAGECVTVCEERKEDFKELLVSYRLIELEKISEKEYNAAKK